MTAPLLGDRHLAAGGGRTLLVDGVLFSRYLVRDYGGHDEPFERVKAAAFYDTEAAVFLPSGYLIGAALVHRKQRAVTAHE